MEHGGTGVHALGIGIGIKELNVLLRETHTYFHTLRFESHWVGWRLWGDLPSVESIQETQAAVVG